MGCNSLLLVMMDVRETICILLFLFSYFFMAHLTAQHNDLTRQSYPKYVIISEYEHCVNDCDLNIRYTTDKKQNC